MKLRPIAAQTSRVDEVADRIRDIVEKGELGPGSRLPSETDLADQFQISRNVLREAIKRLESIGLLNVRRGLGTFVGDGETLDTTTKLVRSAIAISPRDVSKVAEFRRAIECDAVRIATLNATAEDIDELQRIYDDFKAQKDPVAVMEADLKFHLKLLAMAGNALMLNVINVIQVFIYAGMVQTRPVEDHVPASEDQHLNVLKAIRKRDPEQAERAMRAHTDLVIARLRYVPEISKPGESAS
jgi:GntR family transcriptional repressor for pyruvate dehydrogenase complex